jgi:hypothetical protein
VVTAPEARQACDELAARIPFRGGDEHDALSRRAKRLFLWRAGARKRCKRSYQRRLRRVGRLATLLHAATVLGVGLVAAVEVVFW